MNSLNKYKIGIIGLGYVGLPLALEFSKKYPVFCFDTQKERINNLKEGIDNTKEVTKKEILNSKNLSFTTEAKELSVCNIFIITVPTPVDQSKTPDISMLLKATETVGQILKIGDIVIYESTVYPGATEEDCVPVLEKTSGLRFNIDFFCGYSPERINPGDPTHKIKDICKVTSGSTPEIANKVDALYKEIIVAGTHKVKNIKIAEAAKVIENTQRDLNIALVNELAVLFNHMKIDTQEVLKAAATKWNFINFTPGLVGGHCIGVDPYYLTHKARAHNYNPQIILAGRELNDSMASYIADQLLYKMKDKGITINGAKILILGLTFKENCRDLRNSQIINVIKKLSDSKSVVDVYDPLADHKEAFKIYNLKLLESIDSDIYDAVILAVSHNEFKKMGINLIRSFCKKKHIIYDLKYIFDASEVDLRL